MKLGIYGGTFNPIHLGHVHIIQEFINRLKLDKVLIIPTGTPPHKEVKDLASAEQRLVMCKIAVKEIPQAEVSDMEIVREGNSYTADTIALIQKEYPKAEIFLLMGEDMFLTVEKWRRAEEILRSATIVTAPRSDSISLLEEHKVLLESVYQAKVAIEKIPFLAVSSTMVREKAKEGLSVSDLVPPQVADYMEQGKVYRK